jgi:hypothetical protein
VELEPRPADARFARAFDIVQQSRQPTAEILPPPDFVVIAAVRSASQFIEEPPCANPVRNTESPAAIGRTVAFDERAHEIQIDLSTPRKEGLAISRGREPAVDHISVARCRQQITNLLRPAEAAEHVIRDHPDPRRKTAGREDLASQPAGPRRLAAIERPRRGPCEAEAAALQVAATDQTARRAG